MISESASLTQIVAFVDAYKNNYFQLAFLKAQTLTNPATGLSFADSIGNSINNFIGSYPWTSGPLSKGAFLWRSVDVGQGRIWTLDDFIADAKRQMTSSQWALYQDYTNRPWNPNGPLGIENTIYNNSGNIQAATEIAAAAALVYGAAVIGSAAIATEATTGTLAGSQGLLADTAVQGAGLTALETTSGVIGTDTILGATLTAAETVVPNTLLGSMVTYAEGVATTALTSTVTSGLRNILNPSQTAQPVPDVQVQEMAPKTEPTQKNDLLIYGAAIAAAILLGEILI